MEGCRCRLCFKTFPNGRALGGHMRSHLLNLPIPPKPEKYRSIHHGEDTESASSASPASSSSEDEEEGDGEEKGLYYELRENPKKSVRLGDPEFAFAIDAASAVLQDRESETESSKNPTRRRSKRTRKSLEDQYYNHRRQGLEQENNNSNKSVIKRLSISKLSRTTESCAEPEPVSSISGTTTEEDVAFCLIMLSRDKWKRKEHEFNQHGQEEEAEAEKSIEETTDESDEFCKTSSKSVRGKYKCETCNKVFKSYQALGGHRASHKKLKLSAAIQEPDFERQKAYAGTSVSVPEKKIHKCPYCNRIFSSGQALGGHKRSHVTGVAANTSTATSNSTKYGDNPNLIDLNLPAPVDDDDISQIELSAVSDAEFVNYGKR